VGLRVTDVDGASDTDTASVVVANIAPFADAGGPYSGDQGAAITVSGSASSDPGNDIVGYAWDLDNDGFYDDATGVSAAFSSALPGTFTVGLRVTDADGDSGTAMAGVTVNDTAPAQPVGLSAVAGNGQVVLDWTDNGEADLAGYRVQRSQGAGWSVQ
jgi:PKD repeat protein